MDNGDNIERKYGKDEKKIGIPLPLYYYTTGERFVFIKIYIYGRGWCITGVEA